MKQSPSPVNVNQKPRRYLRGTARRQIVTGIVIVVALACISTIVINLVNDSSGISYDKDTMTLTKDGKSYRFILVEGGQFKMGSQLGAPHSSSNEAPQHGVSLSSYIIGATEVPQWLWNAVIGNDDEMIAPYFTGGELPVENVSWLDCQKFILKLNRITGHTFRLPSEAEWEYAARGGKKAVCETRYAGSDSATIVGWIDTNSSRTTARCGAKLPNPIGLYDMTGNVAEWTNDYYGIYPQGFVSDPHGPATSTSSTHVIRGGSFSDPQDKSRIKSRIFAKENMRANNIGFRLVSEIQ